MTRSLVRRWCMFIVAGTAAFACTARQDPPKVPLDKSARADRVSPEEAAHSLLGPAARAALDSGNALFRKKAYDAALAQYRAASELAPQHAAPLFGIYMVGRATSNSRMADSALAGIRLRSGAMTTAPHVFTDSSLQRMHDEAKKKRSAS